MCVIGTCKSKYEKYFVNQIIKHYPNLDLVLNDTKTLSGLELDILIPSINVAIEVNGMHHYKPLYHGTFDRFNKVLSCDNRKKKLCKKLNINLITVDISDIRLRDKRRLDLLFDTIDKEIKARLK